tara:strand:- start:1537 stop:2028 length:492 start_codon:yes stop_codon:yes gene_type:complete
MNQEKMAVTCEVALINSQNLSKGEVELLGKAHEAAANAYAPYSGFHVGAAVRLKSGTVVLGNNQENIAYPSGLCGERVAVFAAGAQFPEEEIESIAIVSPSPLALPDTFMPCGSCRQVLREAELRQKTPIKIYLQARDEVVMVSKSASNLLPFSFTVQNGVFK